MVKRPISSLIARRLRDYPAVALVGPRQSGKTTLARQLGKRYLARLRGEIDRDRERQGRFLLLGSVSPALMTRVSGVLDGRRFPTWQRDYLDLLRQRDLPTWGLPAAPQTTLRLPRMLASGHGQEWNASQLGKSLGLSYHAVDSYLDNLVGVSLFRRLEAYHANIRKRLVKRPKIYWRDLFIWEPSDEQWDYSHTVYGECHGASDHRIVARSSNGGTTVDSVTVTHFAGRMACAVPHGGAYGLWSLGNRIRTRRKKIYWGNRNDEA